MTPDEFEAALLLVGFKRNPRHSDAVKQWVRKGWLVSIMPASHDAVSGGLLRVHLYVRSPIRTAKISFSHNEYAPALAQVRALLMEVS